MAEFLPLPQLAAFEAAARHLSFTTASAELNVQQPAVSRQVAALEKSLGSPLFRRTKPRLTLTEEGRALARAVADGFGGIRSAMRAIRVEQGGAAIVVNAAIGFTSLYLMPRLAAFQTAHPDIPVQIVTRDQNGGFDISASDVVVSFGSGGLPGLESRAFLDEELGAICAPGYLSGGALLSPEALPAQRLLHMSSPDHAEDWDRYLAGTGLSVPQPAPTDRIMSYMVHLLAIQSGRGIGLGWSGLVDQALAGGSLVRACARRVRTGRGYHANLTPRAAGNEKARLFWEWLARQVPTAV